VPELIPTLCVGINLGCFASPAVVKQNTGRKASRMHSQAKRGNEQRYLILKNLNIKYQQNFVKTLKHHCRIIVIFIIICISCIIIIKSKENSSVIKLRKTPITIYSEPQAPAIFMLNNTYRPLNYIKRKNFIDNGNNTISDPATALMWQKEGSNVPLNYQSGTDYVNQLNIIQYKGFSDWRLPTIEELITLLTPKKNPFFINTLFIHNKGLQYWSADKLAAHTPFGENVNSAWGVDFSFGYVFWSYLKTENYVKAVRSITME